MLHMFIHRDCVGCGFCCTKSQCLPSKAIYGPRKKCPALYWNGEKYRCKLIEWSEQHARILQTGEGCCRPLNRWRKDVKERL